MLFSCLLWSIWFHWNWLTVREGVNSSKLTGDFFFFYSSTHASVGVLTSGFLVLIEVFSLIRVSELLSGFVAIFTILIKVLKIQSVGSLVVCCGCIYYRCIVLFHEHMWFIFVGGMFIYLSKFAVEIDNRHVSMTFTPNFQAVEVVWIGIWRENSGWGTCFQIDRFHVIWFSVERTIWC